MWFHQHYHSNYICLSLTVLKSSGVFVEVEEEEEEGEDVVKKKKKEEDGDKK